MSGDVHVRFCEGAGVRFLRATRLVVLHRDLETINRAKQVAADWLKGMGLELKPSKTRITHTLDRVDGQVGFDFLGFHFRQYRRGKNRCARSTRGVPVGFTPSITPSSKSQKRFQARIREIVRGNLAVRQESLIARLNPVIRGWGNYFSTVVSQKVFGKMDMLIYRKLMAWARYRHAEKGRRWVAEKYWLLGSHGWKFGPDEKMTLTRVSDTVIRRHVKVQGQRSPYDGDAIYWSARMGRHPELPARVARLLQRQHGCCSCCGLYFKLGDSLVIAINDPRQTDPPRRVELVHQHCHDKARPVVCVDNAPHC